MECNYDYNEKYEAIKKKYESKLTKEGKIIKYQILEIEIYSREHSISKYDESITLNGAYLIMSAIAVIISMIGIFEDYIGGTGVNIIFIIISLMCILSLCVRSYMGIKNDSKTKKSNDDYVKEQKEKIIELKLEMIVLKNLLLEEDGAAI